jgi:hypothetical protein
MTTHGGGTLYASFTITEDTFKTDLEPRAHLLFFAGGENVQEAGLIRGGSWKARGHRR